MFNKINFKSKNAVFLVGLIVVITIGFWLTLRYSNLFKEQEGTAMFSQEEQVELLAKIAEHIIIFSEKEPLIIKIDNAQQLINSQAFFAGSQDGDILFVYQDKALIYRPQEDVLVNVGPVYINNEEQQKQSQNE